MKPFHRLLIPFLIVVVPACAAAATYPLYLKYQPVKDLASLQQKIGSSLGMAPFKDKRAETLYVGIHFPLFGSTTYFKSDPFPLERAIRESLLGPLFRLGVKTVPIPNWDGQPESLKDLETDSVLMVDIKTFWIEGSAAPFRSTAKTSIHLVIYLGVKKEGKVFTRTVEAEKESTLPRWTPEAMERKLNEMLTEIFDSFFSNPY